MQFVSSEFCFISLFTFKLSVISKVSFLLCLYISFRCWALDLFCPFFCHHGNFHQHSQLPARPLSQLKLNFFVLRHTFSMNHNFLFVIKLSVEFIVERENWKGELWKIFLICRIRQPLLFAIIKSLRNKSAGDLRSLAMIGNYMRNRYSTHALLNFAQLRGIYNGWEINVYEIKHGAATWRNLSIELWRRKSKN